MSRRSPLSLSSPRAGQAARTFAPRPWTYPRPTKPDPPPVPEDIGIISVHLEGPHGRAMLHAALAFLRAFLTVRGQPPHGKGILLHAAGTRIRAAYFTRSALFAEARLLGLAPELVHGAHAVVSLPCSYDHPEAFRLARTAERAGEADEEGLGETRTLAVLGAALVPLGPLLASWMPPEPPAEGEAPPDVAERLRAVTRESPSDDRAGVPVGPDDHQEALPTSPLSQW